ncbi:hypothetical protein O181_037421 [Austropuccinia psidii MF-1]|uniref:Uncharacterized protein n=1 Tax=Austropuccinia psidii MF-1 TaxID=1389203 RepID=A0A9Q3DC27_9BASI|nr:hypothetical protein [Austropuccinia psidii MF-1]
MGRNKNNNPEDLPQANCLAGIYGINEILESQKEFQALRRKRNQNQKEPGSHISHRQFLEYEKAQLYSSAPRNGGGNYIFPKTSQQLQAFQTKFQFIQDSTIIPGSYQKKTKSPREKQDLFQLEEEISRPLD